MKVAQFNTFPYGGAATAATRLHRRLRKQGVDSQFYFHRNEKSEVEDPSFHQLDFDVDQPAGVRHVLKRRANKRRQRDVYRQFNLHLATRPEGQETFSMAQLPELTEIDWSTINADAVHLHWISFFADYPSFFKSIPDDIPIVWTLHDMNAFTGGCHYSDGCRRFDSGCGTCGQIVEPGPFDVSARTFSVKQQSLARKKIHVITPSDWMLELATRSSIWPKQTTFETIRLGFDLNQFRPIAKREARERLGISSDAVLIGFGAEDINSRRKGLQHLMPALEQLKTKTSVECVVFGSGKIESSDKMPPIHHFGYVDSEEKQSLIYSAADLVVVPSLEDNQPQVGLEAMACGTPVVGFDAGGIPEYVLDGSTGLIARLGDEQHLAERIGWLVDHRDFRLKMGSEARLMMEREFELGKQAVRHLRLYESLTQQPSLAKSA